MQNTKNKHTLFLNQPERVIWGIEGVDGVDGRKHGRGGSAYTVER